MRFETPYHVEFLGNVMILYHMKSILKDPARKTMEVHFSLIFYEKNPKNKKIQFFGYKKWSKFGSENILQTDNHQIVYLYIFQ